MDGDKEIVISETKGCCIATDMGRWQLPSQPNSVNDGSAVPKSACKKFVLSSAAVSACVEKVVLKDLKEEALTQCQSVSACAPMQVDRDNGGENDCSSESNSTSLSESSDESESESDDDSGDNSDNDSEEGEEQERNNDAENGQGLQLDLLH